MSKIYSKYLEIKSSNLNQENNLYVFKSGLFFIFVAEDAITASNLLGLKLSNLNKTILKCAFPTTHFAEYEKALLNHGYTMQIVDNLYDLSPELNYINNNKMKLLIDEVINTDIRDLSISSAYDLLSHVKSTFLNITKTAKKVKKLK